MGDNSNTLQLTLQIKDDGTIVIDQAVGKIKSFDSKIKESETLLQRMNETLKGYRDKYQELGIGITIAGGMVYGAISTIKKGIDQIEFGAKLDQIEQSFSLVAKSSHINSEEIIRDIKKAGYAFVDETGVMLKAQQGLVQGLSKEQIVGLTEASRVAARFMGVTVEEAFNRIMESVYTLRTRGLKPAFIVDVDEAMKKYAVSIGKTSGELNELERTQALTNAVLDESKRKLDALGGALYPTNYEKIQRFKSGMSEAWETWSKGLTSWVKRDIEYIQGMIDLYDKIWNHPLFKYMHRGALKPGATKGDEEFYRKEMGNMGLGAYVPENWPSESRFIKTKSDQTDRGALSKEKIEEDVLAFHKLIAEADRLSELGKMPSWEDWAQTIRSPVLRDITQLDLEFAKVAATTENLSTEGKMPSWLDSIEEHAKPVLRDITELDLNLNKIIADAERLRDLGEMPSWLDTLENIPKGVAIKESEKDFAEGIENARLLHQAWLEEYTKTNEMGETLAKNFGNAWNFNIKNIITESKNMGDAVKNVFLGMGDAFTSAVSKMISDWILFGDVTGKYEAGKGIIGWIGGGLGDLFRGGTPAVEPVLFQHGGDFWANQPTLIGVGERGREFVSITPESKMGRGVLPQGNTPVLTVNIYNNNGSQVSQKSRETQQGIEIDVLIDQAVAKKMSTFGSQSNKALRQNFGAKERLTSR